VSAKLSTFSFPASGGGTAVERLPRHLKVEGSRLAGIEKVKMVIVSLYARYC
jgi:hypothetical protein